jgi:hypothetical protein
MSQLLKLCQEAIGTAASVTLIGTACTLVQQIRAARDKVKGASNVLESVAVHLDSLE